MSSLVRFTTTSKDTGLIINPVQDQNAAIIMTANHKASGLLLLFYIRIETLPANLTKYVFRLELGDPYTLDVVMGPIQIGKGDLL